jgi:uncharacterized membrane protein
MKDLAWLVLGLLLFLGVHSTRVVAEDWRGRQLARWGEKGWKGAVALVSLLLPDHFQAYRQLVPLLH